MLRAAASVQALRAIRAGDLRRCCRRIGAVADEICIVRSMQTEQINHDPAHTFMNTGTPISGRPAWAPGSGTASAPRRATCPASWCSTSQGRGGQMQPIAARQWSAGFLPSRFQGVQLPLAGRPGALPARPRAASTHDQQREVIDAVRRAQPSRSTSWVDDPEIATRIAQYEMAFRMQTSVPELMDSRERAAARARAVRRRRPATARSPPTACWPGGWPSAACASSSSTTATGTTTAASRATSR